MRIFLSLSLALGLFFSLMLLFPRGAPTTLHAQSADPAPITATQSNTITSSVADAVHDLYLPLIHRGPDHPPTPTPSPTPPPIKERSGIHLGNRGSSDWRAELFTLITTDTVTGTWPAAVVVQSSQVYSLTRAHRTNAASVCRITGVTLKLTGEGEPYNVYNYLTSAVAAGVKVVIRITPSPGNFVDYAAPGQNHALSDSTQPAGGDYCDIDEQNIKDDEKFRDYSDIAQEMKVIYDLNRRNGWPADSFYFEPANEPNLEWYVYKGGVDPNADNKDAWIDMDNYFAALYEQAKSLDAEIQILSAPMGQENYAEHYVLGTCDTIKQLDKDNGKSGIDYMKQVYGYDFETHKSTTPKVDGFSWHNYWNTGEENWHEIAFHSLTLYCAGKDADEKTEGEHFIQYLSGTIIDQINNATYRPHTFITESDRKSPCQNGHEGSAEEGEFGKDANVAAIRDSLLTFVEQEVIAKHVVLWILSNQYADEDERCITIIEAEDGTQYKRFNDNHEINWHEAYREDGAARPWFLAWWPLAE